MRTPRKIGKDLLDDNLRQEIESKEIKGHKHTVEDIDGLGQYSTKTEVENLLEGKLDKTGTIKWEQVVDKPKLAHDSWKSPVATFNDLPTTNNNDGDLRMTLDTNIVYTWKENALQWEEIGANDINVDWSHIQGKPTTYTPKVHNHSEQDITDLDKYSKEEVNNLLSSKANKEHSHTEAEIIDLDKYTKQEVDAALSNKSDKNHNHTYDEIEGKPSTFTPSEHQHVEADISDLDKYTKFETDTLLNAKADKTHYHEINEINGLATILNNKVEKIEGKGLSTNDFTDLDKSKLDSLTENANVDYETMFNELQNHKNNETEHITSSERSKWNNKADKTALQGHIDNATVHITQTERNTWNNKADASHQHTESDISDLDKYTKQEVNDLLNEKANVVHTHEELHTHMNKTILDEIEEPYTTVEKNKLSGIEDGANNYQHPSTHPASIIIEDSSRRFVSDAEKAKWNEKSEFSGDYNDLTNKPSIPTRTSQLTNDSGFLTSVPPSLNVGTAQPTNNADVWYKVVG